MADIGRIKAVMDAQKVIAKLRAQAAKATKAARASVIVGYTASYAIYVHERLDLQHKPGKTAKFLTGPAKALSEQGILQEIIVAAFKLGRTMAQCLLLAGLRIQRESMMVVPVDTGALRASAFTKLE